MVTVQVLLFGRLKLERCGAKRITLVDGSFPLTLPDGSSVGDAIHDVQVPAARVGMVLVNGRNCPADTRLSPGDRVVLVPQELDALWPPGGHAVAQAAFAR